MSRSSGSFSHGPARRTDMASQDKRLSILDLLPSHHQLLQRHRSRVAELLNLAVGQDLDPAELGVLVADTAGMFGEVAREAGDEFVVVGDDSGVAVVLLGIDGLVLIVASLMPEALSPIIMRPARTITVVVVDADDEPALMFVALHELLTEPA